MRASSFLAGSSPLLSLLVGSGLAALLSACSEGGTQAEPGASRVGLGLWPGNTASQALAVSADGSVVVGSSQLASGKSQAVRWRAQDGLVALGLIPEGSFSRALAASSDGSVVVGEGDAATARAVFRWSSRKWRQFYS